MTQTDVQKPATNPVVKEIETTIERLGERAMSIYAPEGDVTCLYRRDAREIDMYFYNCRREDADKVVMGFNRVAHQTAQSRLADISYAFTMEDLFQVMALKTADTGNRQHLKYDTERRAFHLNLNNLPEDSLLLSRLKAAPIAVPVFREVTTLEQLAQGTYELYRRPSDPRTARAEVDYSARQGMATLRVPATTSGLMTANELAYQLYVADLVHCTTKELPRLPRLMEFSDFASPRILGFGSGRLEVSQKPPRIELRLTGLPRSLAEVNKSLDFVRP